MSGARITRTSGTTVTLGTAGELSAVRDSTNSADIGWTGTLPIDIAVAGAGGLDTGVVAVSTFYAIHVIDGPGVPVAGLFSLSGTAPTLPAGYTVFRRIGWVQTTAAGPFFQFTEIGNDRTRRIELEEVINPVVLSAGGATVFTPVALGGAIPSTSVRVQLLASFVPGAAVNFYTVRPTGAVTMGFGEHIGRGGVVLAGAGNTFITPSFWARVGTGTSIDYLVTGATSTLLLITQGWEDHI